MILTDEKLLRTKCEDVLPSEVAEIKTALESELKHSAEIGRPGIGLAAPQIGIYKKMAIVRVTHPNGRPFYIDLVNLKSIKGYDKKLFDNEGCLSFPDRSETTQRYHEIHVSGNMVEPHDFIATGLLAVVIQHEWDHINGILLPDVAIKKSNQIKPAFDKQKSISALQDFLKK